MKNIRLESASAPFANPGLAAKAARVVAYAGTTGLLEGVDVKVLDAPTWGRVVKRFRDLGVGKFRAFQALRGHQVPGEDVSKAIDVMYDAIEASPMPASEWISMREFLKDELLERLLNISRQSIQRYASKERDTPQDVAERLHVIALVVSDLAGSYNEFGIRRWFDRPRAQLGGKSPAAVLHGPWKPDADLPRKVRELAAYLGGAKSA
jgi:uncharacterized protein (DUF2384 family)